MTEEPPPPYSATANPNIQLPSPDIQVYTTFVTPANFNNSYTPISNGPSPQTLSSFASPLILTPPSTPDTNLQDLERSGFVSALPYFELRTQNQPRSASTIYHHLMIDSESGPHSILFPQPSEPWHAREVDMQDCA